MTQYDYKAHRKACIDKAIKDGYISNAREAQKYEICEDGQFHLKADMFTWFPTHINIEDFEI